MAINDISIKDAIRHHIAEEILFTGKVYPHADDASFLENGIVDSMGVMQLVMFVEEQFQVTVADGDIVPSNFDSVTQLAAYIRRQRE